MPRVSIDNRDVDVPAGSTILDAARKIGIDIPTLCFLDGYEPATSCMLCLVRVEGRRRLVPSCATPVEDGMQVDNNTDEIREIRKVGLELLLSDHLGDCSAPCQHTCPAGMDIPLMMQQVDSGDLRDAIATVKTDIALPAILGRVCPDICERTCRRGDLDQPSSICRVKRYVADSDLASDSPYIPDCKPSSGKSVAIVGAGPTGLTAAFHLLQEGHACTIFDEQAEPGGRLRARFDENELPRDVLKAELAVIERTGAKFEMECRIGRDVSWDDVRSRFDAVLLAVGTSAAKTAELLDVPASGDRLKANTKTHETTVPGVFAAGNAVQPSDFVVRAVAQGKSAAYCISEFLSGKTVVGLPKEFHVRAGRIRGDSLVQLAVAANDSERSATPKVEVNGYSEDQAVLESQRCMHCECRQDGHCKLQDYSEKYGAKSTRFGTVSRPFERHYQPGGVVYEPAKCIRCGICIKLANEAATPLGLTFVGRGFDVRVGVPFGRSMDEGMAEAGQRCIDACPTGALARYPNEAATQ